MCVDIYIILHHHLSHDSNLLIYVMYKVFHFHLVKRCQNDLQLRMIYKKKELKSYDINEYRNCNII